MCVTILSHHFLVFLASYFLHRIKNGISVFAKCLLTCCAGQIWIQQMLRSKTQSGTSYSLVHLGGPPRKTVVWCVLFNIGQFLVHRSWLWFCSLAEYWSIANHKFWCCTFCPHGLEWTPREAPCRLVRFSSVNSRFIIPHSDFVVYLNLLQKNDPSPITKSPAPSQAS